MRLNKRTGEISHDHFYDLPKFLKKGDCLILNDTKVMPARLYGAKEDTGGAIEFFAFEEKSLDEWEVILRPGKRAKPGARFVFGEGELKAEIIDVVNDGNRIVKFFYDGVFENVWISSARCRCRRISPKSWRIKTAIRRYT